MNPGEVFVSVDIEADGPIPGEYSMLSFGATAFTLDGDPPNARFKTPCKAFYRKMNPLPGAKQHPNQMAWWATQPTAWAEVTTDTVEPAQAMADFKDWLLKLPGRPVLLGFPITFDSMFIYWYYWHFNNERPLWGFQGLDIKTWTMARLGCSYSHSVKARFPRYWFKGTERQMAHRAVDDAVSQAVLFQNIFNDDAPGPDYKGDFLNMLDALAPSVNVRALLEAGQCLPEIAKTVALHVFTWDKADPRIAVLRTYLRHLASVGEYVFKDKR